MTEFEQWWSRQSHKWWAELDKTIAQATWHAAQMAVLRIISDPPYVPKAGETIRFLSLCHPNSLGKPIEVTKVTEDILKVYWLDTKHTKEDGEYYSSGILGEVEPVK